VARVLLSSLSAAFRPLAWDVDRDRSVNSRPPTRTKRVLLIEDDAWIRSFLRDVLTDSGYVVVEAADGRTGIRLAFERKPHLVLLDLAMPEVTGVDVLHELQRRASTRNVPVLVISAYTRVLPPDQVERLAGVYSKPLDIDRLLDHTRALLEPNGCLTGRA